MTFRDYYLELKKQQRPLHPAKVFMLRIATITKRSPKTVSQWVCGTQQPPKQVCLLISKELGIDPDDLFPEANVS